MVTRRLPFHNLQHRGVGEGVTPFPGLLHFTLDPYLFWVFGKTRYRIEPRSPGLLLNTLPTMSMAWYIYIYICVCVCVRVCLSILLCHKQNVTQGQFLSCKQVVTLKNPIVTLFTYNWGDNCGIHTFPEGIFAIWNANILVQNLNSDHWFNLL